MRFPFLQKFFSLRQNSAWDLFVGDIHIGHATQGEYDYPWMEGDFRVTPEGKRFLPYFTDEEAWEGGDMDELIEEVRRRGGAYLLEHPSERRIETRISVSGGHIRFRAP